MKKVGIVLCVIFASCRPDVLDQPQESKFWSVEQFMKGPLDPRYANTGFFGGFNQRDLVADPSGNTPFSRGAIPNSLVVRPAFSQGREAAYAITEVWANHPNPWVQPVYLLPETSVGKRPQGGVFPVGIGSTFYSPFWRAEELQNSDTPLPESAREFLNANQTLVKKQLIFCPIVPKEFPGVFSSKIHPISGTLLAEFPPSPTGEANGNRAGFVDREKVTYLDVRGTRFSVSGASEQEVVESKIYFFVDKDNAILADEEPAILPNDAFRHSFVRRYNVRRPGPELKSEDGGVPELTSASAIERLPIQYVTRTDVTMAIIVLLANESLKP
jgi:hypothetical protein